MTDRLQHEIDRLKSAGAQPISRAERAAIWERLERRHKRTVPAVVIGAMTTAVALGVALVLLRPSHELNAESPCAHVMRASVETGAACETRIIVGDDTLDIAAETRVERTPKRTIRITRGHAHFEVVPRKAGDTPFIVDVSGGHIVVRGTAFTVDEAGDHGSVHLEHGRIDITWSDGTTRSLAPGDTAQWPRPTPIEAPTPVPTPVPTAPVVPVPVAKPTTKPRASVLEDVARGAPSAEEPAEPMTIAAIMQRQFQLRGQRRYDEAVALLASGSMRHDFTADQRERLSYELARLLDTLNRTTAACAQWRLHAQRFPNQHGSEVGTHLASCAGN